VITAIIILSVLLVASCFIIYNLLHKVERHEDFSSQLSKWVDGLNQIASNIVKKIDIIDEKGIFKSDDYVGDMYKQINQLVKELDTIIIKDGTKDGNDTNA